MTASTTQKAASESASFSDLPPEYFLATDRRDIYIIKGIKIWWLSLVCFWASEIFKFIQLACDASENYQIYFLQTASGVRNIHILNLFSCFWHVRNFSNVFSSTCFWRVRNIDVSNLSSLSETVCFWTSEICSNLRSSNCFWSVRNFSTLFFRQPVAFKFIFLFLTRRNFFLICFCDKQV